MSFNLDQKERKNRPGLCQFTFYVNVVGVHVCAAKGSVVPVAACVGSPRVCGLCECVCVLWVTPSALLQVKPAKGNSSSCMYWMEKERLQVQNKQHVGMQQLGKRDPRLMESA